MRGIEYEAKPLNSRCRFVVYFLLLSFLMVPVQGTLAAQGDDEERAKMVQEAQKEGELMLYGSTDIQSLQLLLGGFNKKYPFIKTNLFRTGSEKLLPRILAETKAKKYLADVVKTNIMTCWIFKDKGLVQKYVSPEGKSFPEEFKDPQGYWVAVDAMTRVIAYNTKLVAPPDVPKSYEDLLQPKWKGKMGCPTGQTDWLYGQLKLMGREKGIEFMKKLAKQEISFRTGHTLVSQLLAAGEFSLALVVNAHGIERLRKQGAPVDWVAIEPILISASPAFVMAHAPHPNAGRLFVDYMLSEEGQKIIRSQNRISLRPDVPPDPPRLTKGLKFIHPDPVLMEKWEEYTHLYNDIFINKVNR